MASLTLKNIRKSYEGGAEIIGGVDLDVRDGELMVLVGPSGCGKSTLLRVIAGLETAAGDVLIDGVRINDVAPARRGIAMVFQSYALYPHMTVAQNMSFALRLAGHSRAQVREAVQRAAQILQIDHLLDRKPKALSGGQRQRVAIGRAIVRKPKVFLFDEPLSNLDASLRVQMRTELARLHRELGATMIYVTHDQVEAMTLGSRIAVLNGGRIEQVGAPMTLYDEPANLFVAGFLGSPRMNLVPVKFAGHADGRAQLRIDGSDARLGVACAAPLAPGAAATLGFRPDHVELGPPSHTGLTGVVDVVERLGDATLVHLRCPHVGTPLVVRQPGHAVSLQPGDAATLRPDPQRSKLFDAAGLALS